LDAEELKAMGVLTVGQRLSILKSAYNLKLTHEIPITEDDYIPPCKGLSTAVHVTTSDWRQQLKVPLRIFPLRTFILL
jgi:bZIP factor